MAASQKTPQRRNDGLTASKQKQGNGSSFRRKSVKEEVSCRICGRTLLMGEQSLGHFTRTGEGPFEVCLLCEGNAKKFGLTRHFQQVNAVGSGRRSVIARAAAKVSQVFSPPADAAAQHTATSNRKAAGVLASVASKLPQRSSAAEAQSEVLDPVALLTAVGTAAIPATVTLFNQSEHSQMLAALIRSLGEPSCNVQPRSSFDREVVITVAWDIVWYRFRVATDGTIERENGTNIQDLPARWRNWNCRVDTKGRVRLDVGYNG